MPEFSTVQIIKEDNMRQQFFHWGLTALATSALLACGGGGSGGTAQISPNPVLSGVVAVGSALPSVTVTVTDANGVDVTAQTGADGSYQVFDPAGVQLKAPFKVKVKSLLGNTEISLNSFAQDRGTTSNVTPLTTAIAALVNAANGYDPVTLDVSTITSGKIADATAKLASALAPVLGAANVSVSAFNPVNGTFVANNQGIDSVMDRIAMDYTSAGVSIINKFAVLTEGNASPDPVIVTTSGTTGTLPAGMTPPSATVLTTFANKIKKCFAVDAAARVRYTVDTAGRSIYAPGSLHADCSAMVDAAYRAQGQNFGQRWLYYLSSADFNSTTQVVLVPQYVVDKSNASPAWPGNIAYVYNINLIDKNNLTYTQPDVLAMVDGDFVMRGNQRKFDVGIQAMYSKLNDNNTVNNSIEARLRIGLDPTLTPVNNQGVYAISADGTKPLPKILCAWVTGPLLQKNEIHDPNNPKGGVLMVPPHSDYTARRDYAAVRIKYPMGFDPINNSTDKQRLFDDCKTTQTVGSNIEVGSAETNSAFTIDAVKTNATSTASFKPYSPITGTSAVTYPTSLTRTACPVYNSAGTQTNTGSGNGNTGAATTAITVSGWCNSTKRESLVDSALQTAFQARYKDVKDVQFTFYIFVDSAYSDSTPAVAYNTFTGATAATDFFNSAQVVNNVRMVGTFPFLDKTTTNGVEVYAGNQQFRGVGPSMISTYLAAGAATVAKGTSIPGSWTIPAGAEGIDRLGIGGWFRKSDGSRIGAATFSDSFGLPRSKLSGSFALTEDWYGYDSTTYKNGQFRATPYDARASYREIWVRSYDRNNRQIQTVEYAVR